jgi:hypothetical protein
VHLFEATISLSREQRPRSDFSGTLSSSTKHSYTSTNLIVIWYIVSFRQFRTDRPNGEARFVSFRWTPGGDEADYDDGQRAGTGEWQGYLAYIQHPTIHPLLDQYNLGSSESEAKHALILDRQDRKLYVAPIKDARAFLAQQWPELEPVHMTQEEYLAMVTQTLKNVKFREPDIEEIQKRIEEQYRRVETMQNWLNKFLPN